MTDVMTREQRSVCMSRIRGRGNEATELKLMVLFRGEGIMGWRRHLALPGRPDFTFPLQRVVIFVDGCFWHGCPRCYQAPKHRAAFWRNKIERNRARDREVGGLLRARGWTVVRVWECRLRKSQDAVLARLRKWLGRRPSRTSAT